MFHKKSLQCVDHLIVIRTYVLLMVNLYEADANHNLLKKITHERVFMH